MKPCHSIQQVYEYRHDDEANQGEYDSNMKSNIWL